jgi:hypothetical protein
MANQLDNEENTDLNVDDENTALDDINSNVNDIYVTLNDLNIMQTNGLSKQTEIKKIIDSESQRLEDKKKTIDQALLSQNRIIYFNDNSRKVYAAYLRILITLTITLAIVWVLRLLEKHVTFIPIWILNILMIASVSVGLIIMYIYYIDIRQHNKYNFDEINMSPPKINTSTTDSTSGSDLSLNAGLSCTGSDCCSPATEKAAGSKWDEVLKKCIYDPIVSPTTPSSTKQPFTTMNSMDVKARDNFEYTQYAKY